MVRRYGLEDWVTAYWRVNFAFAGNAARCTGGRRGKLAILWKPNGGVGWNRGRPLTRWEDDLENLAGGIWQEAARDISLRNTLTGGFAIVRSALLLGPSAVELWIPNPSKGLLFFSYKSSFHRGTRRRSRAKKHRIPRIKRYMLVWLNVFVRPPSRFPLHQKRCGIPYSCRRCRVSITTRSGNTTGNACCYVPYGKSTVIATATAGTP